MPNYSGVWALQQQYQSRGQNIWPSIPGAPTSPVATPGNTLASVAFVAPSNSGYPAITSYRVISSPGGFTGTGATSPVTVSGLTNGTAYTFTVTAQNAAGYGPASVASNSVTPAVPNYIEETFSTYLYKGNDATQTVTNGINLSANGGLVWIKNRGTATNHRLYSTGLTSNTYNLVSNTTAAQADTGEPLAFASNGWSITGSGNVSNNVAFNYASWTFRKQPKFFDVVTFTQVGSTGFQTINHNLGSVPGCVMFKSLSVADQWVVYHRSVTGKLSLNTTDGAGGAAACQNLTSTDFQFNIGNYGYSNGVTFVAYVFAHDAGGFGTTGADNVISCGSYTGNGISNGPTVTLGYEPQFLIVKRATGGPEDWVILDNMRGWTVSSDNPRLSPNLTAAETNSANAGITSTGFKINGTIANINASGSVYIYIAVRRGPMKVPTLATTVFGISARTGTGANATVTGGTGVDDAVLIKNRGAAVADLLSSRLTNTEYLVTSTTAAGVAAGATILQASPWDVMDGVKVGTTSTITNASANTFVNYLFSRAPGFMDVVPYTGTSIVMTVNHNLGAVPELMIFKNRSVVRLWPVYTQPTGNTQALVLNASDAVNSTGNNYFNSTSPTNTVFTVNGTFADIGNTGNNYVAYLFATLAGVSKVGSYTGTAALQTVACGFAAGARFVMIKRTDVDGDWYYWDSVRGLSSGNDPYLLMNTAAAEVTATNYVDTDTTGFKVTAAAPAGLNASGGNYIFLAIA